jgi:hypothetical protein
MPARCAEGGCALIELHVVEVHLYPRLGRRYCCSHYQTPLAIQPLPDGLPRCPCSATVAWSGLGLGPTIGGNTNHVVFRATLRVPKPIPGTMWACYQARRGRQGGTTPTESSRMWPQHSLCLPPVACRGAKHAAVAGTYDTPMMICTCIGTT